MADDNKLDFILDLDSTQFAQKVIEGISRVEALGASLSGVAVAAGTVGVAMLAVKTAIDLTFEAETIKAVNSQFDILAQQAGVAGDAIKSGMEKASGGLLTETEQLQLANKAIIDMGSSAARIPEIMDLARRVAMITGQDIASTFQNIEQAIATGQTRQLKNYGIVIDSNKAYRDYAASLGIAANELSKTGQQHAILNQALDIGHTKYANIQVDVKEATNAWTALKVALSEIGEMMTLTWDKIAGPTVRSGLNWIKDWAVSSNLALKTVFTDGAESAAAKADYLKEHARQLKVQLDQLKDNQTRITDAGASAQNLKDIDRLKKSLAETEFAYHSLAKAQDEIKSKGEGGSAFVGPVRQKPDKKNENVDLEQRKRNEAQYQKDIAALQQSALDQRKQLMTSDEQAEAYLMDKKIQINEQAQARIAEIQASQTLNPQQKAAEEAQVEQARNQQLRLAEQERIQIHQQAAENMNKIDQDSAQGFANAWASGSRSASLELSNWNATGQRTFKSFGNNATSALLAFGAGQKSASEAAKAFIFGMLADEAEARGKMMLLASIWPPNPAGLAAGAGLIALSGFLRSQGAGSGAGGSAGGVGASAGGGGGGDFGSGGAPLQQQQQQKAVTVQIMGSYFETEQTKQRLVEMIRESSDATDFVIK